MEYRDSGKPMAEGVKAIELKGNNSSLKAKAWKAESTNKLNTSDFGTLFAIVPVIKNCNGKKAAWD